MSRRGARAAGERLARLIAEAPTLPQPWPHVRIAAALAPSFHAQVMTAFPAPEAMERLSAHSPDRYMLWLRHPRRSSALPPFWQEFLRDVVPPAAAALAARFGVRGTDVGAEVVLDRPGYLLPPHTDVPEKRATLLVYLDGAAMASGTSLYRGVAPDPAGRNHAFGPRFTEVETVPFVANTGFAFARSDWSYHGVRVSAAERRSLSITVLA